MIRMVVVEDESFERNSIINYVDWDIISVEVVGEAANGAQGLSVVMDLKPDIVLTDVKMPVMEGIEMSRRIRNELPETKIIFMSSYDDFEYARQAIDLNISAYLMKPVKEGELLRVVKRMAGEISEARIEQRINEKLHNNHNVSINLARQALVNRLLTGMPVSEGEAAGLDIDWLLRSSGRLCLAMSIYDKSAIKNPIDDYLGNLNRELSGMYKKAICICINAGALITLCMLEDVFASDDTERLRRVIHKFFSERGVDCVRIELKCDEGGQKPSDLYAALFQQDQQMIAPFDVSARRDDKQAIAEAVENIIAINYNLPLTLESIAKSLHFTPNYIGSIYKFVRKISVNRYLMKVRLEKAIALLTETGMPAEDIATQCGYGNVTYFYKVFKTEKGVTPSEFRNRSKPV